MPNLTKAKPETYSPLERDDALTCLALGSGNPQRVNDLLEEKGITIPISTIRAWAYGSERERYQRIRQEVEHFRNTRIADQVKANALLAGEIVDESLTQLQDRLKGTEDRPAEDLPAEKLAGIAKNSSVVLGIHVQRGEELEGKPTHRLSVNFEGLLKEAKELGMEYVDGEAEELEDPVEDAQLAEGDLHGGDDDAT